MTRTRREIMVRAAAVLEEEADLIKQGQAIGDIWDEGTEDAQEAYVEMRELAAALRLLADL